MPGRMPDVLDCVSERPFGCSCSASRWRSWSSASSSCRTRRSISSPEFAPPRVEGRTEALGLSAEEVEQLIRPTGGRPPQRRGISRLDPIRIGAGPVVDRDDVRARHGSIQARQIVAERLTQAHALPNVSKPPAMLQPLSSSNRVMMVSLWSERAVADRHVGARALDDPPPADGSPGSPTSRSGAARAPASGAGRPDELQQPGVSLTTSSARPAIRSGSRP